MENKLPQFSVKYAWDPHTNLWRSHLNLENFQKKQLPYLNKEISLNMNRSKNKLIRKNKSIIKTKNSQDLKITNKEIKQLYSWSFIQIDQHIKHLRTDLRINDNHTVPINSLNKWLNTYVKQEIPNNTYINWKDRNKEEEKKNWKILEKTKRTFNKNGPITKKQTKEYLNLKYPSKELYITGNPLIPNDPLRIARVRRLIKANMRTPTSITYPNPERITRQLTVIRKEARIWAREIVINTLGNLQFYNQMTEIRKDYSSNSLLIHHYNREKEKEIKERIPLKRKEHYESSWLLKKWIKTEIREKIKGIIKEKKKRIIRKIKIHNTRAILWPSFYYAWHYGWEPKKPLIDGRNLWEYWSIINKEGYKAETNKANINKNGKGLKTYKKERNNKEKNNYENRKTESFMINNLPPTKPTKISLAAIHYNAWQLNRTDISVWSRNSGKLPLYKWTQEIKKNKTYGKEKVEDSIINQKSDLETYKPY